MAPPPKLGDLPARGSKANVKPDRVVTLADAQAIVARIDPGLKVASLSELLGGAISAVYEANLAGGAPNLIIKIYPDMFHWKLAKEVSIYRRLSDFPDVPVPRVIWHDDSKTVLPLNLLVMSKIDGDPLLPLEASLSEVELFDLYRQMGRTLRQLHEIRMEAFGYLVAEGVKDPHSSNDAYMRFQFGKKLQEFRDLGGDRDLAVRMERFVAARNGLLAGCAAPAFCHDDFHTGNMIVAKRSDGTWRLSGILDVENAIAGDPLIDIAKTLAYSVRENRAKRDGLLMGYGPIARAGWEETVDLYRLYHALEHWDWAMLVGMAPFPWLAGDMERITAAT
jgi:aminoglycoside phosphotransferase (APT) family kinase protein